MTNARLARLDLIDYFRQHGAPLGTLFVALTALMFFALRQLPVAATQRATAARRSAGMAFTGALLASLIFLAVFAPRGPFMLHRLVGFAAPLLAGVVATRSFAAPIPATAWTLVLAVFFNEFRIFAEMSPGLGRLLLAFQVLPFGAALIHDWRRGALARFLPRWPPLLLRRSCNSRCWHSRSSSSRPCSATRGLRVRLRRS